MRVGKFAEHFQAALKATSVPDGILRLTAIGRQLGYGLYLVHDSLVWVRSAALPGREALGSRPRAGPQRQGQGLCPGDDHQDQRASEQVLVHRYRCVALHRNLPETAPTDFFIAAFSLLSGLYATRGLQLREANAKRARASPEKEAERKAELKSVQACVAARPGCPPLLTPSHRQSAAVRFQLIQDSLDILIPASSLGYLKLDEGVLGIVGCVPSSSVCGSSARLTRDHTVSSPRSWACSRKRKRSSVESEGLVYNARARGESPCCSAP
jgi:hypothetical protein